MVAERRSISSKVVADRLELASIGTARGERGAQTTSEQPAAGGAEALPYDPVAYRRVYESVLRRRRTEVVPLESILPTAGLSAYDFSISAPDLTPMENEADAWILEVERQYRDLAVLEHEVARWWEV